MARFTMLLQALALVVLSACATVPSPNVRKEYADALAASKGWQAIRLDAGQFELLAYIPRSVTLVKTLTVYIEGDGFSWLNSSEPSSNPTPRDPLSLKLALAHPTGGAVYLSRPCQYVNLHKSRCQQHYWTDKRFAPEVVDAVNQAVEMLKLRFEASQLLLVGYSGGAAVAALVAARRQDVVHLVTVGGNLDHQAWTKHHRLNPLYGSLNAADVAEQLNGMPQTHFIGSNDRIITLGLAQRWPVGFTGLQQENLHILDGLDHAHGWVEQWPLIMMELFNGKQGIKNKTASP